MSDTPPAALGRLVLVPNALDHGSGITIDLRDILPSAVIQRAATLSHWIVEDAKSARAFLKRVDAVQPLVRPLQAIMINALPRPAKGSHPAPMASTAYATLLDPLLSGHDLGLLSEAGLPALADPGAPLVAAAHAAGLEVEALPGATAIALALAASGLNGQSFAFLGYLPNEEPARGQRIRALEALSAREHQTQIVIETPYRNRALMDALVAALAPHTLLSVSCGLTLPGGFTRTRTVASWRTQRLEFTPGHPAVFAWLAPAR
jgi:16S rRNA (cytidine1402-2'-O)-methyltransferase